MKSRGYSQNRVVEEVFGAVDKVGIRNNRPDEV